MLTKSYLQHLSIILHAVSKNNMWASHGLDRFCVRPYSVIGPELQVRGDLKLRSWLLKYPRDDVTCQEDAYIPLANRHRHPYSKHDDSYLYATLLGKVFDHSDCLW